MTRRAQLSVACLAIGLSYHWLNASFDLSWTDFRDFYDSAERWRAGDLMYQRDARPTLTPPWFPILISPITVLPLFQAYLVWTALNLSLAAISLRWIALERPDIPIAPVMLGTFALLPAWLAWHQGQVTWCLMPLLTRAWLAPTLRQSAFWLAPAIMLKPQLALMALALPWPVTLWAGVLSASGTAVLVAVLGPDLWREWLASAEQVTWLGRAANLSLWGLATRLEFWTMWEIGLHHLSRAWWVLIPLIGASLYPLVRRCHGDTRWSLAFLWAMLLSPLGWAYYWPAFVAPFITSARPPILIATAVVFWLPNVFLNTIGAIDGTPAVVVMSLPFACAVAMVLLRPPADSPTASGQQAIPAACNSRG